MEEAQDFVQWQTFSLSSGFTAGDFVIFDGINSCKEKPAR
jgi:hypothetical protein